MKKWFIIIWLVFPIGLVYLHFHYGPRFTIEANIGDLIDLADDKEDSGEWSESIRVYDDALSAADSYVQLQGGSTDIGLNEADRLEIQLKLRRAKAMTNDQNLALATSILEGLLEELDDAEVNDELADEVRSNLAQCLYYIGWHMRIEGMLREDWLPELESSRQIYKYLSQKHFTAGEMDKSSDLQKNLEAVIRMERMDLPSLRKMKLPKKRAGKGQGGAGKGRKKSKTKDSGKGKKSGKGNKPGDSRKADFKEYKLPAGS